MRFVKLDMIVYLENESELTADELKKQIERYAFKQIDDVADVDISVYESGRQ